MNKEMRQLGSMRGKKIHSCVALLLGKPNDFKMHADFRFFRMLHQITFILKMWDGKKQKSPKIRVNALLA